MSDSAKKTLGQAIDAIIEALEGLDDSKRATAIKAAVEQFGLGFPLLSDAPALPTPTTPPRDAQPHAPSQHTAQQQVADIRSLKDRKQPANSLEMAALTAYYLQALAPPDERRKEVTGADLERYFRQAEYPLPKRIGQVLIDAKAAGYFDLAGRGTYRLNPVGYNLVVHKLPRSSAPGKEALKPARKRVKRPSRRPAKRSPRKR